MNFLWTNSYYVGNKLFDFTEVVGFILLFVFIFSFAKPLLSKIKIKNPFLSFFCKFLILLFLFSIGFWVIFFKNIFSSFLRVEEEWDGCICGCIEGSYEEFRYIHRLNYIFMCVVMYLNLGRLYFYIFKNKIKSGIKNKKRNIILIFLLISIIFSGLSVGVYYVLDKNAPNYEIYD